MNAKQAVVNPQGLSPSKGQPHSKAVKVPWETLCISIHRTKNMFACGVVVGLCEVPGKAVLPQGAVGKLVAVLHVKQMRSKTIPSMCLTWVSCNTAYKTS